VPNAKVALAVDEIGRNSDKQKSPCLLLCSLLYMFYFMHTVFLCKPQLINFLMTKQLIDNNEKKITRPLNIFFGQWICTCDLAIKT